MALVDRALAVAREGGLLDDQLGLGLEAVELDRLDELCEIAAEFRRRGTGTRITYSRKVFIPLTRLCRDRCHYCTFAGPPHPGEAAYLSPDEVLAIARAGAATGCQEALFTLGDRLAGDHAGDRLGPLE